MTDKSYDRIGHFNTILARGAGNLNDPIFKSSNARVPGGGGGVLKCRVNRRIKVAQRFIQNAESLRCDRSFGTIPE